MDLKSKAEKRADSVRDLPEFQSFSLPAVRSAISEMASAIGSVEGIFLTYTKHDIRHVDSMLSMLDWIVPPNTTKVMTSVDWLLVVLGVYFHDLGMIVTAGEYQKRKKNEAYGEWLAALQGETGGPEFMDRISRMMEDEKETFLFQEFVRSGHARRIREWITGNHSRKWGKEIKPIAEEVAGLLSPLSNRFREYLGLVCESHHNNAPEDTKEFPLCARLGNDPQEIVNVQYAAVLLRTTDLLHVNKNRTPSVMYKIIRFSDPKSVEEWDKQRGVFSVGPKGRTLIEDDPESAVIVISADFTEERPLFALQEYVAYAQKELQQSGRWIEKSQQSPDGKEFSFPWHAIKGDIRLEGVPPQPLSFELDRLRLLDLLVGHMIYNDPTVAIRELMQNALDAVRYQHYLNKRSALVSGENVSAISKIMVHWNPATRVLVVRDNGIGMDKDVIKYHLMRVGASFYATPAFETEFRDFSPISRFGIGILTCFMISDDIEIITFKNSIGHRIRMTKVDSDYLLRELQSGDEKLEGLEPHGTRVEIKIRGTVDVEKKTVEEILRYWVILPECPVEFIEEGNEPVAIGFESVQEALTSYHTKSSPEFLSTSGSEDTKIKVENHIVDSDESNGTCKSARYELAYVVNKGFTPEWHFASRSSGDSPAVCIEGIRVSGRLPWYSRGDKPSCLLAVHGDRSFRTTVARSGLEKDKDFDRVGEICGQLLFHHVQEEVSRISRKKGQPLSQAATAAQWLRYALRKAADCPEAISLHKALVDKLPSLVLEVSSSGKEKQSTSRDLISPSNLRNEEMFWTVESRLVDSLGIISRDLGREVSLNEFLTALAPELKEMQFLPILLDAHLVKDLFYNHYRPDEVIFSRRHQQSAVRWQSLAGTEDIVSLNLSSDCDPVYFKELTEYYEHTGRWGSERTGIIFRPMDKIEVGIAEIRGDDAKIEIIKTRLGTILKKGGTPAEYWTSIRQTLCQLAAKKVAVDTFFQICSFAALFISASKYTYHRIYPIWNTGIPLITELLSKHGFENCFPKDIQDYTGEHAVFDASSYWRDWLELHTIE